MKLSAKKIKLDVKGKKQMKHKNYDVIVAWANGEKIEYNHPKNGWIEVHGATPNFGGTVQFRIKKPPQDFAIAANVVFNQKTNGEYLDFSKYGKQNVEFIFDGETQMLKDVKCLIS